MSEKVTDVKTFGDARRLIIQTIIGVRDGEISVDKGMAIAANMKVLNDNIQAEINTNKLFLLAEARGHKFGTMVTMGRRLIGSDNDSSEGTQV